MFSEPTWKVGGCETDLRGVIEAILPKRVKKKSISTGCPQRLHKPKAAGVQHCGPGEHCCWFEIQAFCVGFKARRVKMEDMTSLFNMFTPFMWLLWTKYSDSRKNVIFSQR